MAKFDTHLTPEILDAFHKNQLNHEDYLKVLEHTAHCTYCASLFAESFDSDKLVKAPPGLKDSVLAKTRTSIPNVHFPWLNKRNRQMFFYSLKVCAAMCGALLIILSSMRTNPQDIQIQQHIDTSVEFHFLEDFSNSMRSFSDDLNQQMNNLVNNHNDTKSSQEEE